MSLFNPKEEKIKQEAQTATVKPDNTNFWEGIRYFESREFDSPDLAGSGNLMNKDFVKLLDTARERCGFAFHINSGFRTPSHNASIGGASITSTHMKGTGADIRANTLEELKKMETVFRELGIGSIGLYKWTSSKRYHIHIDNRNRNVTWYQLDGVKNNTWYE